jgi:hypothetical protein
MTNPRAQALTSLMVLLYVAAPTTIMLTAHETVRVDKLAYSADRGYTADRHGDLLRPGTSTVRLDRGTYHFRTTRDAALHVTDPASMTMRTSESVKCIPPPSLMPGKPESGPGPSDADAVFGIKGNRAPGQVPALTITYGDTL